MSALATSSQRPRQHFALRVALRRSQRDVAPARVRQSELARDRGPRPPPLRLEPVSLPPVSDRGRPRRSTSRTGAAAAGSFFLGARRSRASSVGTYHASRLSPPRAACSANCRAPAMSHPGHQRHARSQSAFRIRPRLSRTRSAAEPFGGATHCILSNPAPCPSMSILFCPPFIVHPMGDSGAGVCGEPDTMTSRPVGGRRPPPPPCCAAGRSCARWMGRPGAASGEQPHALAVGFRAQSRTVRPLVEAQGQRPSRCGTVEAQGEPGWPGSAARRGAMRGAQWSRCCGFA